MSSSMTQNAQIQMEKFECLSLYQKVAVNSMGNILQPFDTLIWSEYLNDL